MTSQFDFTNDQWQQLASAPYLVGLAVARAEDSGLFGSVRESRAMQSFIEARPRAGAASHLIAEAATTDVSELYDRFKDTPPGELAEEAVESCGQLASMLADVAEPAEADDYKRWVLDVARVVAEAAKEHGERVSPGEAALLERITAALVGPAPGQ